MVQRLYRLGCAAPHGAAAAVPRQWQCLLQVAAAAAACIAHASTAADSAALSHAYATGMSPSRMVHTSADTAAEPPERLTISGDKIMLPDGTETTLRGFNMYYLPLDTTHGHTQQRANATDGTTIKKLLPRANLVRNVVVHWNDDQYVKRDDPDMAHNDCYAPEPEHGYLKLQCVQSFDHVLKWTTDAGLWTTITLRGAVAAGGYPGYPNVFTNKIMRTQLKDMWKFLAERYSRYERIAAYEVLSEPRMLAEDREAGPSLNQLYAELCTVVQKEDPRTPCMVGNAKYYDIYPFNNDSLPGYVGLIPNNSNVIYTSNFFAPKKYVHQASTPGQGADDWLVWPGGELPCNMLYEPAQIAHWCPDGDENANVTLNVRWLEKNLKPLVEWGKQHKVPVLVDQWGVFNNATGSLEYLDDMLWIMEKYGLHWTYWAWKGEQLRAEPAPTGDGATDLQSGYGVQQWNFTSRSYQTLHDKLRVFQKHLT